MLKGFDPIISKEPKVMILGSMPSAVSLEKQEYYGYAHNRFWKIMSDVFEMPISTYEEKKQIIYFPSSPFLCLLKLIPMYPASPASPR